MDRVYDPASNSCAFKSDRIIAMREISSDFWAPRSLKPVRVGALKTQDRKMRDQLVTGVENAGPENEGPRRIWKMKDHDVSENGLQNKRISRKTTESCSAIGKAFEKQYLVGL